MIFSFYKLLRIRAPTRSIAMYCGLKLDLNILRVNSSIYSIQLKLFTTFTGVEIRKCFLLLCKSRTLK